MNYIPLHFGDFLRDTMLLDQNEVGAYALLRVAYCTQGGMLPPDEKTCLTLAKARTQSQRAAARAVLERFFPLIDGTRNNPELNVAIGKACTATDRARENGSKSKGRPPKTPSPPPDNPGETQRVPDGIATAAPPGSDWVLSQNPESNDSIGETEPRLSPERDAALHAVCVQAAIKMNKAGCGPMGVNAMHPKLVEAVRAGITAEELEATVVELKPRQPDGRRLFTYAIGTAIGRRQQQTLEPVGNLTPRKPPDRSGPVAGSAAHTPYVKETRARTDPAVGMKAIQSIIAQHGFLARPSEEPPIDAATGEAPSE